MTKPTQSCVFCRIAQKEVPSEILLENDLALVFADIHPSAPVHYLVVPKEHIETVSHLTRSHAPIAGELILLAKEAAHQLGLSGYKLVFNVGRAGGQIVDHIHLHLLGGWKQVDSN